MKNKFCIIIERTLLLFLSHKSQKSNYHSLENTLVAIFENESYYTCPVTNFSCVCFRAESVGTKSNIKTENDDAICVTKLRPGMCKLIFLTKSTASLARPEFSQQAYNSINCRQKFRQNSKLRLSLRLTLRLSLRSNWRLN